jgi:hypothetical protein
MRPWTLRGAWKGQGFHVHELAAAKTWLAEDVDT